MQQQPQQVVTPRGLAAIGCFIGVLGIPCLLFAPYFLWSAFSSGEWESTTGRVDSISATSADTDIRVSGSGGQLARGSNFTPIEELPHAAIVNYSYTVDGSSYSGDRYSLGGGSTALTAEDRATALEQGKEEYPVGSEITVYYDPEHPDSAVLAPGLNVGSFVPLILGILFGPPALWLILKAWLASQSVGWGGDAMHALGWARKA